MKTIPNEMKTGDLGPVVGKTAKAVVPAKANNTQLVEDQNQVKQLDVGEKELLRKHEGTIKKGLQTFQDVGMAFAEIRDRGLYREHGTFDEYCQKVWGISRSKAYRYMAAGKCVQNLECCQLATKEPLAIPANESQARNISKLPAEMQVQAAKKVAQKTNKPTAEDFDEVAEELMDEKPRVRTYDIKSEVVKTEAELTAGTDGLMAWTELHQLVVQVYNDYTSSLDGKVRDGFRKLKAETKKWADKNGNAKEAV